MCGYDIGDNVVSKGRSHLFGFSALLAVRDRASEARINHRNSPEQGKPG